MNTKNYTSENEPDVVKEIDNKELKLYRCLFDETVDYNKDIVEIIDKDDNLLEHYIDFNIRPLNNVNSKDTHKIKCISEMKAGFIHDFVKVKSINSKNRTITIDNDYDVIECKF